MTPKTELHVHLRGAMPLEFFGRQLKKYTVQEALSTAPERFMESFRGCPHLLPAIEHGADDPDFLFAFDSFETFLRSYLFSAYFIRDIEDFRGLAEAVRAGFEAQGLEYVEITVSVFEYTMQGVPIEGIAEVLDEVASQPGVEIRWIVDLIRNLGPEQCERTLREMLRVRPESWVGITIGGNEREFPPAQFVSCYDLARSEGLGLSVHAGEAAGPESVWDSLRVLRADRIGHGVRSVEDPALVDYLAERGIPLEVCLTGNVKTGVYSSYQEHSLPALHAAGVKITLNTDDPTFFRTTLADEFDHAARLGLTPDDLAQFGANAGASAFGI